MNENTKYWVVRVAVKLHKQFLSGMDFDRHEYRWVFDWDKSTSVEENLERVAAEEKALVLLAQVGAIKSSVKENYFRDQQYEAMEKLGRGMWGDSWERTDPAHREYDYIRWIDGIDYRTFVDFCDVNDISYKEIRVPAVLEIVDQIPSVQIGGKKYYLKALKAGTALDVIEAARSHSDERLSAERLRLLMGKQNALTNQKNFNQIFRNNEFGKDGALSPFAEISSDSFMLKQQTNLTNQELDTIQRVSTN